MSIQACKHRKQISMAIMSCSRLSKHGLSISHLRILSTVGTGCILIQAIPDGKRIVSANSRVFDKAEQKMSQQHLELCGIISALQTYEFYNIGSPFPIYLYCDHRPILFLWSRKGQH